MTEKLDDQEIRDSYARLGDALAPPVDVARRVERRIAVHRRRRRAGTAGAAVLGLAVIGGSVVALASGNDGSGHTIATDQPAGPASTLVMTRPDGSTYSFDDVTVSCDPPVTTDGTPMDDPRPGQIWAYSPIDFNGSLEDDDVTLHQPFVLVQATVAKLQEQRTFELPIDGPGGSDTYPITLFMADTAGAPDGNEVSSGAGGSGTVTVLAASCDPTPVLRLRVDATVGSEEGKQSLELAGVLR